MTLVPPIPTGEAEDEHQSAGSEASSQLSMESDSEGAIVNTATQELVDAVEQAMAEAPQGQPTQNEEEEEYSLGIDLFADFPPPQVSLPPPSPHPDLPPLPQITAPPEVSPNEEAQSDDEDGASTSDEDADELQLEILKKPYCAFITSNHYKEHSPKPSTAQRPRPLLIVTKEEIYLFQSPSAHR
ncbi:uncharacterized protein N0V89_009303 [Didymosphaeria variabile]|uniref:Uncharacterized protein n=1 Tax=Didymosphaeria variabile TaxID=1932322 RepID=A0A9W8XET3_9PLEO|nr:uncharacterized protein N0V89_009303 [Didymosphaeria variabile]KAJ4347931.1 hypothetical protein N0V89_009303 [Didymosphaeria variabile]